jgi:hypothetical protein
MVGMSLSSLPTASGAPSAHKGILAIPWSSALSCPWVGQAKAIRIIKAMNFHSIYENQVNRVVY